MKLLNNLSNVYSCSHRLLSRQLKSSVIGKTPKTVSADVAVQSITSGNNIYVHAHASTPTELLHALCRHVDDKNLSNISLNHIILQGDVPWTKEKYWGRMRSNCLFICPSMRPLVNAGLADYVPVFLSDTTRLYDRGVVPVDVALISVSPPDEKGYCTIGVDVDCSYSAIQQAKSIIAIVNPSMPQTFGDSLIHSSQIDYFVHTDRPIYAKTGSDTPTEVEEKIGKIVAENLIEDGATLQLGIGAIPDSTLHAMKNHKDLGIHSELISDAILDLLDRGVINNSKKTVEPGRIITSFAFGTRKFYDVVDKNPLFQFRSCGWTNHVDVIRENSKMTCINSALEIDLTGQIVSDSIGSRFYSGFGGQVDFIFGSSIAKDNRGKAIIALPSRTTKGKSKIVPTLPVGAGVVTTRGHVNYVVTEYGVANLWGKNVRERARQLINIAHPDDREQLEKAAFERLKCQV